MFDELMFSINGLHIKLIKYMDMAIEVWSQNVDLLNKLYNI